MKILIAGGAGFIGSNLSTYFIDHGHQVTIIDSLITGQESNIKHLSNNRNFRFIKDDICSFDFKTLQTFNLIYHLASPASPIQYKKHPIATLRANSFGTEKLIEFTKTSNSDIFVFASTSEIYGDPLEHPQKESYWGNVNPVGPRACYDEAKRFGEALLINYQREFNLDIRVARIFNTYGPNMEKDDGRVVSNFIMQALINKPITIYGTGQQTRSFCYVNDMVEALVKLGTIPDLTGQIINLGNPNEITIKKLAEIIKYMIKSSAPIVEKAIDADDPKMRKPDISKANKLLSWQPKIKLETGLQKTIEYFRTEIVLLRGSPNVSFGTTKQSR